jgi:hypothetical protein
VRNFAKICLFLTLANSDKYFSRPILDISLLYKHNVDLSEYDEIFSLNLFLYFSVATFLNYVLMEYFTFSNDLSIFE